MTTPLQLRMGVEAPHRNRYLFSDHYLENILPDDPRWQQALTEAETFCDWLREHYADEKDQLPDYNESQLEQYWFRPIFERLGHVFELQASVPGLEAHAKRPDYVFFPDEDSRQRAASLQNEEEYAEEALAVGEVKRWDTPLSKKRRGGGPSFEDQNPSFQIDYYVRITAKSGLDWGILTNGRLWRLVHKDSSQRLNIYYEVDLVDLLHRDEPGLMRYFLLFFRQAAFRPDAKGRVFLADVLAASNAYAIELEEDVEENVYHALEWLMQGFLNLPDNELGSDDLQAVYDNSLYLLYRLLFILYGESRGLLPMDSEDYREHYSLESIKRAIVEGNVPPSPMTTVVWRQVHTLFRIISGDKAELNRSLDVPRYDGGLFNPKQHPFLEEKEVGDQALVAAIDLLSRRETDGGREFVDYRTLSVRHLGSIYEGLLEYHPENGEQRPENGEGRIENLHSPSSILLVTDRGERKATGSYYTPQYIVEYIVEHTLGPLVERGSEAANNGQAFVDSILDLKVLDPAMGSGHFLVEATEYLARALATDPYVEAEQVTEEDLTYWKRRVVERCIYGVDKNPLAVELAKLSLWLATVAADRPLSFLDHHLKCGDSLIGARVDDLGWAPPPALSKQAQKQVEQQKAGQINMFGHVLSQKLPTVMGRILEITEQESKDYDTVRAKEAADRAVRELKAPFEAVADLWVSAYFGNEFINGEYDEALGVIGQPDTLLGLEAVGRARAMAEERGFFHWELAFPEVFYDEHGQRLEEAGFDVVMGNPPYGDILNQPEKAFLFETLGVKTGGRAEVYTNFIVASLNVLRARRRLGFIIPNTLIDGAQFDAFREYLTSHATIHRIRDFRSHQVFVDADVMTMILILITSTVEEDYTVTYEFWGEEQKALEMENMAIEPLTPNPWWIQNGVIEQVEIPGLCVPLEPGIGTCHDAGVDYKWKGVGWQNRGARTPLSELLFYSGEKQHPDDYALIKGSDIDRYSLKFDDNYLIHDFEEYRTSENTILVYFEYAIVPVKLVTRQTSDRIQAVIDLDQHITAKSVHTTLVKADGYSPWYVLAILNSGLLTYIYQIRTGEVGRAFAQVKLYDLRKLPIRHIDFTTPTDEREALVAEAKVKAEESIHALALSRTFGADTPMGQAMQAQASAPAISFVEERLNAEPEQADVIHDLLAHLAERMIEMNEQKQERVESFWLDLEGVTDADTFEQLSEHGKWEASLWKADACRPFVDEESRSTRHLDESLGWNEDCFKVFVKALAGRVSNLSEVIGVYRRHHPDFQALARRIAATDRLIDLIVYRLYGLKADEVAVVEGET